MKKLILIVFLTTAIHYVFGQKAPAFWKEILDYKKADSANPPPQHAILFVGSSSFRLWKDVAKDFPGYEIINRGVGGSTLPDITRYFYDIILPYHPRQIVIYCGENDLATPDSITPAQVSMRFKTLFGMIRQNLPHTAIDFVSIKPSPSRMSIQQKIEKANQLIKEFIETQPDAHFINVYPEMVDGKDLIRNDIFREDMLHMNDKGYAIWIKDIKPYLKK